ncbi:MAG: tRNA (adenine57-N1/adenine58-N1)-methyltransferase [Methanobacteriota archaeon]|jgi:tRNA (adenine57-N1/adenine58-N1)-methyltransferase|uniref:Methyltransferase domain-containing protein n=1 Tax=Halorutilus salinus TaxID=2487751 RepID=A0A9Q4C4G3_9EURY|nr:methyltransferase domain-containing protein [Halorutilus salinus]MCX2818951.1 methyltransferase domain-containing protein [Halorutilus salinus]
MEHVLLVGDQNTYLRRRGDRVELQEGVLDADDLEADYGATVETHIGEEFVVAQPDLNDIFDRLLEQRTQTISHKDAGYIVSRTGIGADSAVAEAGTGSGFLTLTLARSAREVRSYEVRDDHIASARRNIEKVGAGNVTVTQRDVKEEGFEADDNHLVVLDMKHPEDAVPEAAASTRNGGYVVCYCPVFEQVRDCADVFEDTSLRHAETVEVSRREWRVFPARPEPQTVPHTAFLTFARKL